MIHTPSSYPRLRECLGAVCLPNVHEEHDGMRRGTAIHAYAEAIVSGATPADALAAVPEEWRADVEEIDTAPFEHLQGTMAEVGLAWHPANETARVLGTNMSREQARAGCRSGEIPMVLDVLAQEGDGLVVIDWKSERGESLGPAQQHWQLLTYMAVASLAFRGSSVRGSLATWRGSWAWSEATLDALEAEEHLASVRRLLLAAADARAAHMASGTLPPLKRGRWCQWCPAQRACPAFGAQLIALVRNNPGLAGMGNVAELTREEAGAALVMLKDAKRLIERMLADLNALAKREPLPLPDGSTYAPREQQRLEAESAHSALTRTYGRDFADDAAPMVRTASLSATVKEAIRKHLLPARRELAAQGRIDKGAATMRALEKEVRGVLEAAGAFESGEQHQLPEGVGDKEQE